MEATTQRFTVRFDGVARGLRRIGWCGRCFRPSGAKAPIVGGRGRPRQAVHVGVRRQRATAAPAAV